MWIGLTDDNGDKHFINSGYIQLIQPIDNTYCVEINDKLGCSKIHNYRSQILISGLFYLYQESCDDILQLLGEFPKMFNKRQIP